VSFVRAVELVRERADDDLDHVRLTRSFLEDPQRFLHHLLDGD
jgi:hypothetical protein